MAIWGVDPGRYGGLAIITGNDSDVYHMPATDGHTYNIPEIAMMLGEAFFADELLVIERVTRPASLTRCMGIFEGLGVALGYRVETVRPQDWKRAMGLTGKDKRASMELASSLFPALAHEFVRVTRDDGKAEALLIAEYGRRHLL